MEVDTASKAMVVVGMDSNTNKLQLAMDKLQPVATANLPLLELQRAAMQPQLPRDTGSKLQQAMVLPRQEAAMVVSQPVAMAVAEAGTVEVEAVDVVVTKVATRLDLRNPSLPILPWSTSSYRPLIVGS
jgi:hypothetical protein